MNIVLRRALLAGILAAAALTPGALRLPGEARAGEPRPDASAAANPPPRLYTHIQDASQRDGIDNLRKLLANQTLAGMPITVVAPSIDAPRGLTKTQLRCVTRKDCELAATLAGIIGQALRDKKPQVVDLSARFDGTSGTRPYHYELWFAPGPVGSQIEPAPGAEATAAPVPGSSDLASADQQAELTSTAGRLPLRYSLVAPATVKEGDVVALNFYTPASDGTYSVKIDGVPAAILTTPQGVEVTVPRLSRNFISSRLVRMDVMVGPGWRLDPAPTLDVEPVIAGWAKGFAALAALMALMVALMLIWKRGYLRHAMAAVGPDADSPDAHVMATLPETASPDHDFTPPHITPSPAKRTGEISLPPELIEACVHGESLLFLGGEGDQLSIGASHGQVLGELLARSGEVGSFVKMEGSKLLDSGDLDTVADLLADRLGRPALVAELAGRFAKADVGVAKQLARLGCAGAVSSLFAETIEQEWPEAVHLTPKSNYDFNALLRERQRFVLRLRGKLDEPASVNLTTFEIGRAIEEAPSLREVLSGLFASRTALFVGLDAAALGKALETAGIRMASGQRHYALVHDASGFEISAERFSRQYGIEFIRVYGADDLKSVLQRLGDDVEKARDRSEVTPTAADAPAEQARITRLKLTNIGPFANLKVEFRSQWTVLLGNNGAGKSTILRAIALALCGNDALVLEPGRALLRRGKAKGSIEVTLASGRTSVTYSSLLSLTQGRLAIRAATAPLQSGTTAVFGFPAMRGLAAPGSIDISRDDSFPHPRVADVLPIIAGGADERGRSLKQWIFRAYLRSLDTHLSEQDRSRSKAMIDGLFKVIDSMTPGFDLRFSRCDADTSEILLHTSDGEVPLDYISQGMTSTLGWIGPMVQRLCEIHGSAEGRHAILLIDEIDSHLHPAWQQKLVQSLKENFPNVQVIATTHSPLMVGNLGENEVARVIRTDDGLEVEYLEQSFIGYRFDQILTDKAFGLERARSSEWKDREKYAALLGKSDRTAPEEAELERIAENMRKLPGPSETPAERRAALDAERELQRALEAATLNPDTRGDRSRDEGVTTT